MKTCMKIISIMFIVLSVCKEGVSQVPYEFPEVVTEGALKEYEKMLSEGEEPWEQFESFWLRIDTQFEILKDEFYENTPKNMKEFRGVPFGGKFSLRKDKFNLDWSDVDYSTGKEGRTYKQVYGFLGPKKTYRLDESTITSETGSGKEVELGGLSAGRLSFLTFRDHFLAYTATFYSSTSPEEVYNLLSDYYGPLTCIQEGKVVKDEDNQEIFRETFLAVNEESGPSIVILLDQREVGDFRNIRPEITVYNTLTFQIHALIEHYNKLEQKEKEF